MRADVARGDDCTDTLGLLEQEEHDHWTFVAELLDSIIVCNDQQYNPNSEDMTILHHNKKATGTGSAPARRKSTGYVAPPANENNDAVSKRTRSSSSHNCRQSPQHKGYDFDGDSD